MLRQKIIAPKELEASYKLCEYDAKYRASKGLWFFDLRRKMWGKRCFRGRVATNAPWTGSLTVTAKRILTSFVRRSLINLKEETERDIDTSTF